MSEESAGWLAQQDQWQAAVRHIAGCVGMYYRTLRALGIGVEPATQLTLQYQQLLWTTPLAPPASL